MAEITVLLSTFNGARFLDAQLASVAGQDADWALWASDDGSCDGTVDMLTAFAKAHPDRDIRILQGPRAGSARNFLSLLTHPDLPDGPVALCDQDDVWLPHHLSRGLRCVNGSADLYACATLECDVNLENPRLSRAAPPPTGFGNALVQNVVAGNTMVMSAKALQVLRAFPPAGPVPYHDWWVYLVLTGHGARIHIDPEPGLMYRQHDENELGASRGIGAFLKRLRRAMSGDYATWIRANTDALAAVASVLSPENARTFATFKQDRGRAGLPRLLRLHQAGIRRETRSGTVLLYIAAGLGRI